MEEQNNNVVEQVQEPQAVEQQVEEKMLPQSKVNEVVEGRLKREREKLNKEWQEKFDALQESIKLQSMSEEQKQQHELDKRIQDLEAREKALQEKENAYNKQQYQNEIENQLRSKGLPTDLAELLVDFDAQTVASKIDSLAQSMGVSITNQIQEKLKNSSVPQEPTQQPKGLLSREEIERMSPQEYRANQDLINESLKHLK